MFYHIFQTYCWNINNNDNILTYQTIYCLIIVAEQYSSRENELYYVILQIPVTSSLKKVHGCFRFEIGVIKRNSDLN